jgi:hypothetical protein
MPGVGLMSDLSLLVGRGSPDGVAGYKAHVNCEHTRFDRMILEAASDPRAEEWDRAASDAYRREHPR